MNVVITTLNSKYIHSSLALRYLWAYGQQHGQAYDMVEYTINMPVLHILNQLTDRSMDVVGFACYIWNIDMTLHVASLVKAVRPQVKVVLGGPEVSFTARELLEKYSYIDYIVQGEGEEAFTALTTALATGGDGLTPVIPGILGRTADGMICGSEEIAEVADLNTIPFPYTEADLQDLDHRIMYYESSRGCPFSCQYCLSGNKNTVRFFPLERTKRELQWFMDHNIKQVKFVDRTFNCAPAHHRPLMEFIAQANTDTNFHLEMEPALMTEWERDILCTAPKGRMQIEVGVQSTHVPTLDAVKRYNDWPNIQRMVRPIIDSGHTHVHMDLIVGLPKEDFKRFGQSFNDLFSLQPQALQIGFLKLLRGSGVSKMDEYQYVCDSHAPYEVLKSHVMTYDEIKLLKNFEDVFERFYNSERFRTLFSYLGKKLVKQGNAFDYFMDMTHAWMAKGHHLVSLKDIDQIQFLYEYLLAQGDRLGTELLQYDTLVSYKGKVRDGALHIEKPTKEQLQDSQWFWRNEALVQQYIEGYTFTEWRQLKQRFVEMDMHRETALYIGADVPAEVMKPSIIIDVTGENRPFMRPRSVVHE